MKFNKLIPELSVSNIERSKLFYTEVLGFRIEYERVEDKFAFLSLGEAQIMIEELNDHWDTGSGWLFASIFGDTTNQRGAVRRKVQWIM